MTARERVADAMRLKDAELRQVTVPSWAQLADTDRVRWLMIAGAGETARMEPGGLPYASLRIVHQREGEATARITDCAVVADGHVLARLPITGYTLDMDCGAASQVSVRVLAATLGDIVTHAPGPTPRRAASGPTVTEACAAATCTSQTLGADADPLDARPTA